MITAMGKLSFRIETNPKLFSKLEMGNFLSTNVASNEIQEAKKSRIKERSIKSHPADRPEDRGEERTKTKIEISLILRPFKSDEGWSERKWKDD
jgi:hypothetical protein